ncbi:T9SS type A sorting domain-containing protein [candidate division WOR-3 bacterium]|uniref:T9SS type A sorting domain-containing protein n=1 Tax=candidate division WOR-3 bacterium TaxID=2052148 RepID=A0A9D5K9G2_UNCW3|nr:T9SS type A sorting domain-containing protein [candidate division WOR-3 bacterium]MBD3364595.1 T9SS type A sorting domain-containing protein [candidate division WOR-3 bacterium]
MNQRKSLLLIPSLIILVLSIGAHADLLLTENFTSWGTWATSPPTNWQINYSGSAEENDWHNADWHWSWAGPPETDQGVPTIFWDPVETGTDEFISPVVDCSAYDEVWITLTHSYDHYQGSYQARILGSTNGGGTFPHVVWDYGQVCYGGLEGKRDSINVSSWAAGASQVAFNWKGEGNVSSLNVWNFDDVNVYGFPAQPAEPFDLKVTRVLRPSINEHGGDIINPTCCVYNNADSVAYAEIMCSIKDIELQETVFSQTVEYCPLDPHNTDVDTFSEFTLEENKKYEVFFLLTHPDDADSDNNDKTAMCCTKCDQVTPTEIISPEGNQSGPISPQATFTEDLEAYRTSANLHCKITSISTQDIVYIQTLADHIFGPNQSKDPEFPEAVLTSEGSYEITFWATDREGADISDIDLVDTFNFSSGVKEIGIYNRTALSTRGDKIRFELHEACFVEFNVYDACGKLTETIAQGGFDIGSYSFDLTGLDLAKGVYFVRLKAGNTVIGRKLTILH